MSLEYIRSRYEVPAKKGAPVIFDWPAGSAREGRIVGARDAYLLVRFDDEKHPLPLHPTWRTTYPAATA